MIAALATAAAQAYREDRAAEGYHVPDQWTAAHAPDHLVAAVEARLGRPLTETEFAQYNAAFALAWARR